MADGAPLQETRLTASTIVFDRPEWAALRDSTPLSLSEADLQAMAGLNERVSREDVTEMYVPISRLLNLHIKSAKLLNAAVETSFLGRPHQSVPFVIAIAGSVAAGKSTFARILRAMLAQWPEHKRVDLVTTDGFLYPTQTLRKRSLMRRKGFPESYDRKRMLGFLAALKAGAGDLEVPVYSHQFYDIVPGHFDIVDRPDVVIFEGLNVLQTLSSAPVVASDFFDFSIYLDADLHALEDWYVQRFLLLQREAFQLPTSYFHHYKDLTALEAERTARGFWDEINLPNLQQNILPTRERARMIVRKGPHHAIDQIRLRRT